MKLVERIKKVIITIVLAIISFPNKIFAKFDPSSVDYYIQYPDISDYGVVKSPGPAETIWRIARNFIIPIALLIGLIVYFKKSKSSTKKKILVTLGIIALVTLLYFVVNKIIVNLNSL